MTCFSALQRAEIAEIVIFNIRASGAYWVSVLFNEPKLLKSSILTVAFETAVRFSALQRAEIAEIHPVPHHMLASECFSALQRAEIAEIWFACP